MKSELLKKLRTGRQITQRELAEALKVSQQTVASWEVGRTEPNGDLVKSIANFFGVPTDYLLGNESPPSKPLTQDETRLLGLFRQLPERARQTLLAVALQMTPTA